jgi:hypothetical protein
MGRSSPSAVLKRGWAGTNRWLAAPATALLAGVGLRVWYYLLNDSFWRDESKLLLNAAQKSFTGLLGFLQYDQEAPVPLLCLYRLLYVTGLGGELPLRAVSLAASILTLWLFYLLLRRSLTDTRAVLFAAWLLALSPGVILFAAMIRPYAGDILVAAGLLLLAAPVLTNSGGPRRLGGLTLAAGLAPWLSYPGAFVVGGIALGLLCRWRTLGLQAVARFLGVAAFSLLLEMFTVLKRAFLPGQAKTTFSGPWKVIKEPTEWLFHQIFYAYSGPQMTSYAYVDPLPQGYIPNLWLFGITCLILLGLGESWRRGGWAWVAALIGPLALSLVACYAGWYPPYGRHLLFAVPGLYLLAGYGAALLFRALGPPKLVGMILIILILPCARASLQALGKPVGGVREGLQFIAARQQPGDLVFFDTYAAPTIYYYRLLGRPYAMGLSYGLPAEEWIEGKVNRRQLNHEFLMPLVPGDQGVWLLAETTDYARSPVAGILPYWREFGERLESERGRGQVLITDRVQVQGFSRVRP